MVGGLWVDAGLVVVGAVGLWLGAVQFVGGATRVARVLGVPNLVVGLTVVAFGTSAPEFAVTVDAALTGKADISVGNVVGSNVVNLGFILGGTALVRQLPVSTDLVRRDSAAMVGSVVLLLAVLADGTVSRLEAGVLFALLLAYLAVVARSGNDRFRPDADERGFRRADAVRLVAGVAVIGLAAHALVTGAAGGASRLGVSEWVIGVTVVALGTSAPEFAASLAAVSQGRTNLAAGNVVGSCLFNVLGVLGLAGLLRPLAVAGPAVEATVWLLGIAVVATGLLWTRQLLSRAEGAVLVVLNAVNWAFDLL